MDGELSMVINSELCLTGGDGEGTRDLRIDIKMKKLYLLVTFSFILLCILRMNNVFCK